jgi:uncharacterized protein (TIGR03437 family)
MSRAATVLDRFAPGAIASGTILALAFTAAATSVAWAQSPAPTWYPVGNSLVDFSLAGLASGPVDRVWYSTDGGTLYATTFSGKTFETQDFETWKESTATAPPAADLSTLGTPLPEPGARLRGFNQERSTLYAFGAFVHQSQNGGASWDNLTGFRARSIIGGGVRDLAVSPRDPEELTAATSAGVFRSLDGGRSWGGLNQSLPNLPALRIRDLPSGGRGTQIEIPGANIVEWQPGEKLAWRPVDNSAALTDESLRRATGSTAIHIAESSIVGNAVYQGTADGSLSVKLGGNDPVPTSASNRGPVERFWVDSTDPRIALAVMGARPESALPSLTAQHVLHTVDGGRNWDDLTSNLGDVAVHGVAASVSGRAIYIATDTGVFSMRTDVSVLSFPGQWQPVAGLPAAPVADVRLDSGDNRLWAAVQGFGVYSTLAPHRLDDPKVVSSANLVAGAAAPGSLMSILGAKVSSAQAGNLTVPVLLTTETESQIQIPFEASGTTLSLSFDPATGSRVTTPLAMAPASPGILVDGDGTPVLLDAATGARLDASNPAHSGARIQIVATGLGRVNPDWPAGKPAPADDPPKVAATVAATLNGAPVQVASAVLAPGLAGFYLVEIELPSLVNYGPAELSIEAGGHTSNAVRVYIGR